MKLLLIMAVVVPSLNAFPTQAYRKGILSYYENDEEIIYKNLSSCSGAVMIKSRKEYKLFHVQGDIFDNMHMNTYENKNALAFFEEFKQQYRACTLPEIDLLKIRRR